MLQAIWVKNPCIALQKSNFCQNCMSLKDIALDRDKYLINPKVKHVYFNFTLKYLDSNAKLFDPKLLFWLGSTNHSNIFLILLSFDVLCSKPSLCVYTQ